MTFKPRPYQALAVAAILAQGRAAQPANADDDLLSRRLPINPRPMPDPLGGPFTSTRAAGTIAPPEDRKAYRRESFIAELRAMLEEEERAEDARTQRNLTFLRSVEHIKSPDPRVDWHCLGAGPFFWSRAFAEWWHREHPGLGLPLNVRVTGSLGPASHTDLWPLHAPRSLTVPLPQYRTPQEPLAVNPRSAHLTRGAQWKREKGRRR